MRLNLFSEHIIIRMACGSVLEKEILFNGLVSD